MDKNGVVCGDECLCAACPLDEASAGLASLLPSLRGADEKFATEYAEAEKRWEKLRAKAAASRPPCEGLDGEDNLADTLAEQIDLTAGIGAVPKKNRCQTLHEGDPCNAVVPNNLVCALCRSRSMRRVAVMLEAIGAEPLDADGVAAVAPFRSGDLRVPGPGTRKGHKKWLEAEAALLPVYTDVMRRRRAMVPAAEEAAGGGRGGGGGTHGVLR